MAQSQKSDGLTDAPGDIDTGPTFEGVDPDLVVIRPDGERRLGFEAPQAGTEQDPVANSIGEKRDEKGTEAPMNDEPGVPRAG